MKRANPYLNFQGNAEEAFTFYRSVFGGEFSGLMRFRDFGDNGMGVPENELDKIAHIALPLGSSTLMATDVIDAWQMKAEPGTNFYITLEPDTADEADNLFDRLSEGGSVEMALQRTEWAEKYGTCTDRYGVRWMINYDGDWQEHVS